MDNLIIIGGGGHAKSCIDVIELEGKYNIIGLLDSKSRVGEKVLGYEIIGTDEDITSLSKDCNNFFLAVGQVKNSNIRRRIITELSDININFPNIISPLAYVSKHVSLGKGNIIMHNSFVNADVRIGDFNIINTNSVIEHDCNIGNFSHISVSSTTCGTVNIGDDCFIGAGSTINNNININNSVFIGSHSMVNKDINSKGIYSGNPVRKYR